MAITLLKCNKCCNTVPNNCFVHVSCMLTCVLLSSCIVFRVAPLVSTFFFLSDGSYYSLKLI